MNSQHSLFILEEEMSHLGLVILYFANRRTFMAFSEEDLRTVRNINPVYSVMSDVKKSAIVIIAQIRLPPWPSNPSFLNKYHW